MKNISNMVTSFQSLSHLGRCFLYVNLSICVSVCVSVCVFTFEVSFKRLLAPTSLCCMSQSFRDLESSGESNTKKWSQISKLFLIKGVKLQRKKSLFFGHILPYWGGFFWYRFFSPRLTALLPPLPKVQCLNYLDFGNPWGNLMKRSILIFENFCL